MSYKNPYRRALSSRGCVRTRRHGDWRRVYLDCAGMCVARVNGDPLPCGFTEGLELHEMWGENGDSCQGKFQLRVLLCNLHHALVEDRAHQTEFILDQYRPSLLQDDIQLEIMVEGSYQKWLERWHLDDSRFGCLLFDGPHVEDYE